MSPAHGPAPEKSRVKPAWTRPDFSGPAPENGRNSLFGLSDWLNSGTVLAPAGAEGAVSLEREEDSSHRGIRRISDYLFSRIEEEMDFRKLKYFLRIAEAGSLNKASAKIRISQPSLSRQMRLLEEELGVKLFRRDHIGMHLTSEGEELYRRIDAPLKEIEHALKDIRAPDGDKRATISLAICPSVAQLLAGPLGQRVAKSAPDISLRLIESYPGNTANAVHSGAIDIAMMYGPVSAWSTMEWGRPIADFPVEEILDEDLVLVGSRDCPLEPDRPVDLDTLLTMKFVLPERQNQIYSVKRLVDALEKRTGGKLDYIAADSFHLQRSIIESGVAYGLLPQSAVVHAIESGRMRYAPFKDVTVDRKLVLTLYPDTQYPREMRRIISLIKDEVKELVTSKQWIGKVKLKF